MLGLYLNTDRKYRKYTFELMSLIFLPRSVFQMQTKKL